MFDTYCIIIIPLIHPYELLDIVGTHFHQQEKDSNHNGYCQDAGDKS
jgi:hypothetical protein